MNGAAEDEPGEVEMARGEGGAGIMIAPQHFIEQLEALRHSQEAARLNASSFRCVRCEHCISCTFCEGCDSCHRCTYCHDCASCTGCGHCARCIACNACAYCIECERCSASAYLTRCVGCVDCTYCFGCVGLVRAEFRILNQPYSREDYFAITNRLAAELRLGGPP